MNSKTALIIGATGATGSALVKQLLNNDSYGAVHVFARRSGDLEHDKLQWHVVDFDAIDTWKEKLKGDVLFSAMGTTLKTAGSKDAQYQIDYNYQHDVAQAASENGVDLPPACQLCGIKQQVSFLLSKNQRTARGCGESNEF